MNRKQAKDILPIISAFAEGKTIQYSYRGTWIDVDPDGAVDFSKNPSRYRIKPEPDKNQLPIKDGNIMMTMDKRAFITNGIIDSDGYPCAYCGINLHHDFTICTTIHGWTPSPYIPASEEAKKELFDKMAKAGYKWNAKTLKLEKIEPKYRPFRNKEECWNEMLKHQPFGWIKNLFGIHNVIHIQEDGITTHNGTSNVVFSFKNALNMKFIDGTPFGIKE